MGTSKELGAPSAPPQARAWRPAQVATTVLAIQQQLPRARVVYCSATGVSEARARACRCAPHAELASGAGAAARACCLPRLCVPHRQH